MRIKPRIKKKTGKLVPEKKIKILHTAIRTIIKGDLSDENAVGSSERLRKATVRARGMQFKNRKFKFVQLILLV